MSIIEPTLEKRDCSLASHNRVGERSMAHSSIRSKTLVRSLVFDWSLFFGWSLVFARSLLCVRCTIRLLLIIIASNPYPLHAQLAQARPAHEQNMNARATDVQPSHAQNLEARPSHARPASTSAKVEPINPKQQYIEKQQYKEQPQRLLEVQPQAQQTHQLATPDTLYNQFLDAVSLSITPLGTIYIADKLAGKIHTYSIPTLEIRSYGNTGSGEGQFGSPVHLDATNGLKIYIADRGNRRIVLYDRNFQPLSTIEGVQMSGTRPTSHIIRPALVHVLPTGELYIYNDLTHELIQMNDRGQTLAILDLKRYDIGDVTTLSSVTGELILFDRSQQRIHRFNPDGIYLGFLQTPEQTLSIRSSQNRLLILRPDGVFELSTTQGHPGKTIVRFPHTISQRVRVDVSAPWAVTDFGLFGTDVYLLTSNSLVRIPYGN